jgi:hypothetical protein
MKNNLKVSINSILGLFLSLCVSNAVAQLSATELDRLYAEALSGLDAAQGDAFGISVDVDGDRAVVGARLRDDEDDETVDNTGAAYVYVRNADTGLWDFEARLFSPAPEAQDWFGNSVAIEGDTVVVGVPNNGANDVSDFHKGNAYVFTRSPGGTWDSGVELLHMDDTLSYANFGVSVDIDNSTIVVGVSFDADEGQAAGSAYVFESNAGNWIKIKKLLPPGGSGTFQNFGHSVAIDSDTIAIGAPNWTSPGGPAPGLGAAYAFTRSDNDWGDEGSLLPVTDNEDGDQFGWSVAVAGDLIVVGAHLDDYDDDPENGTEFGSITVFDRSSGNWVNEGKILASDGQDKDHFGRDVATNGEAVIAGAPDRGFPGGFYLFSRSGSAWSEDDVLVPPRDATFSNIDTAGFSLAMDGDRLAVGAHGTDIYDGEVFIRLAGAAFVYEITAPPPIIADYGDAPLHNIDSYHLSDGGLKLGKLVDTEEAAQANASATGDDNDGSDDEDGVFFKSAFIKGSTTFIEVNATGPGLLSAWADFGSGWDAPSEQIFTDQALVAGINELSFPVPDSGADGENAALRFRFSSQAGLAPSGAAPDGEMEDYVMLRSSSSDPDPDNDGVEASIEDAGPNGGDGNNDGILDSVQLDVTSIPTAEGSDYLVIQSQPGTFLTNVSTVDPASLAPTPMGASFPLGALQFNVEGIAPGATVEVQITFPSEILVSNYFKFDGDNWYEFYVDGVTGATVTPGKVILKLTDGGRGDHDSSANGVIVDPGAIALSDTLFEDGFED